MVDIPVEGACRGTNELDGAANAEDEGERLDEEDTEDGDDDENLEDGVSWTLSSESILVAHRRFAAAATWLMKSDSNAKKAVNHWKNTERMLGDNMAPVLIYVLYYNYQLFLCSGTDLEGRARIAREVDERLVGGNYRSCR